MLKQMEKLSQIKGIIAVQHLTSENIYVFSTIIRSQNEKEDGVSKKYTTIIKREKKVIVFLIKM